jgi:hypothetical protein
MSSWPTGKASDPLVARAASSGITASVDSPSSARHSESGVAWSVYARLAGSVTLVMGTSRVMIGSTVTSDAAMPLTATAYATGTSAPLPMMSVGEADSTGLGSLSGHITGGAADVTVCPATGAASKPNRRARRDMVFL